MPNDEHETKHLERAGLQTLSERLKNWEKMELNQLAEIVVLMHAYAPDVMLAEVATYTDMYAMPGLKLGSGVVIYKSQAELALAGLLERDIEMKTEVPGFEAALLTNFRTLAKQKRVGSPAYWSLKRISSHLLEISWFPQDVATRLEFASLARRLAKRQEIMEAGSRAIYEPEDSAESLNAWADHLEASIQSPDEHPDKGKER